VAVVSSAANAVLRKAFFILSIPSDQRRRDSAPTM